MISPRTIAIAGVALAASLGFGGAANACSCNRPPDNVKSEDERMSWLFDRAETIARGRILGLRAGQDVVIKNVRYVSVDMRISSVLKGVAPIGDAKLMTLFGIGDCGIPAFLLAALARNSDVELELRRVPELPDLYSVDMCGYGQMGPAIREKPAVK